jgi:hypothetical protein
MRPLKIPRLSVEEQDALKPPPERDKPTVLVSKSLSTFFQHQSLLTFHTPSNYITPDYIKYIYSAI